MPSPPILSEAHWVWPLVFFPYEIDDSHTKTFTGRAVIGGMKSALARVRLDLGHESLTVTGRLSGTVHLEVPRSGLISCALHGGRRPLVEVRFAESAWSRFARLLVSGSPAGARNRVLLNVDDPAEWHAQIDRLLTTS